MEQITYLHDISPKDCCIWSLTYPCWSKIEMFTLCYKTFVAAHMPSWGVTLVFCYRNQCVQNASAWSQDSHPDAMPKTLKSRRRWLLISLLPSRACSFHPSTLWHTACPSWAWPRSFSGIPTLCWVEYREIQKLSANHFNEDNVIPYPSLKKS